MHETTSEHTDEVLDFLEQQSRHLQIHPAEHPSGLYDAHAALHPVRAPAPASSPAQPASMATRGAASRSAAADAPSGALQQRPAAVLDTRTAAGGGSMQVTSSAEPVSNSVSDAAAASPGGRSLKEQAKTVGDKGPSISAEGHREQRMRSLQI